MLQIYNRKCFSIKLLLKFLVIFILIITSSIFDLKPTSIHRPKTFIFEVIWIVHDQYHKVMEDAWQKTNDQPLLALNKVTKISLIFNKKSLQEHLLKEKKRQIKVRLKRIRCTLEWKKFIGIKSHKRTSVWFLKFCYKAFRSLTSRNSFCSYSKNDNLNNFKKVHPISLCNYTILLQSFLPDRDISYNAIILQEIIHENS
ncbi:hypothetical protein CR513_25647, partial [Mucuna pruriens]